MKYLMLIFVFIFCGCASKSHLCETQEIQEAMQIFEKQIDKNLNNIEPKSIKCENGVVIAEYNALPNSQMAKIIDSIADTKKAQQIYEFVQHEFDCKTAFIKNGLTLKQIIVLENKKQLITTTNPHLCKKLSENNMFFSDIIKKHMEK